MSGRYEISDILAQDGEGVVFQAVDRESGETVALRRFFPFGSSGGGLQTEERAAYEVAVRRLIPVCHPALRSVIDGGTDPVDGMPFLVTEWVDGQPLSDLCGSQPLEPDSCRALLDHALEASEALSKAFGEESIWVETATHSIILGDPQCGRAVTFWISPLRWLGDSESRKGLRPLLELAEEVTGWRGRMISEASGEGLGAWVLALRADPDRWDLATARQALHQGPSIPAAAPVAAPAPATQRLRTSRLATDSAASPARPAVIVQKAVWWPWALALCLSLATTGFLFWQLKKPGAPPPLAAQTDVRPSAPIPAPPTATPAPTPSIQRPSPGGAALTPEQAFELRARELADQARRTQRVFRGQEISLEGVILSTARSGSGITTYIQFQVDGEPGTRWAGFRSEDWPGVGADEIDALAGRRARFHGTVKGERSIRKEFVSMASPEDMTLLDQPTASPATE